MSSASIPPDTIVFALGKFHPPHSGHINILGATLQHYADLGLRSILFITTKTNEDRLANITMKMEKMRARKGNSTPGKGGVAFTKIPVDAGVDFKDHPGFPNSTIPVKGQAIESTQKSIYDRVDKRRHINWEGENDTPLTPELKKRILEHALNSREGNPVIIRENNGLRGLKQILEKDFGAVDGVTPLIMLAGSDRIEGYKSQLENMGFKKFEVQPVGTERPKVGDIHSGKTLRHLAHEAADEATATGKEVLDTKFGKSFMANTGYIRHQDDEVGKDLTLEAIGQIVSNTPRGGKRKSRKRKYNKKRKTKKGKRNRRAKTKRKRNKRKARSRRRS